LSVIFLFLFLLFACTQENNLLLNTGEEYFISSVDNGAFLTAGASIPVSFSETGSRSDRLLIILEDSAGDVIASVDTDSEEMKGAGLPVELPADLTEGWYQLRFEIRGEELLLSESRVYFFIVDGDYSVDGLETYPPGITAGDTISARSTLTYPEGKDPWLRWSLNSEVLEEGLLSEKGSTCDFTVPEGEGVYSLKLEIFPVRPLSYQISSGLTHSDLFVTYSGGSLSSWERQDNRTYSQYFSFESDFSDRMNPDASPGIYGDPVPVVRETFKGYAFASEDGLEFPYHTLPLTDDGTAGGFTVSLSFWVESLPREGLWSLFSLGDEESRFSLEFRGEEQAFLAGFSGSESSRLSADTLIIPGPVNLDLTYLTVDEDGAGRIIWTLQGGIVADSVLSPGILPGEGNTVIGSDRVLPGLPLTWLSAGITSPGESGGALESPEQEESGENSGLEPEVLYVAAEEIPGEISLELSPLGEGLVHLEILMKPDVPHSWTFSLADPEGVELYQFDLVTSETAVPEDFQPESEEPDEEPDTVILSIVNDENGFFLTNSLFEAPSVLGPLPHQNSLILRIVPYNMDEIASGLEDISEIRLFRN